MYNKILVPLDGSKLAEKSLDYAVWLAQKSNAELILLHVFHGKLSYKNHYLQRTAEVITYRTHKHHNGQPAVRVRIESSGGDPATEILKYANDHKIDLITMSTHGHSGIRHWIMGSVADKVVRYSNRPVRLVKSFDSENNNHNGDNQYDQLIVTLLDGSDLAEQILPYASYHAELSGGELVLLSVCEPAEIIPAAAYHLIPESYPPTKPLHWDKYLKEESLKRERECKLYLEQHTNTFGKNKYRIRYEYRFGDAASEIIKFLEDNTVDLIAMTTRGHSGLARWVFGSVAEKVLTSTKSPLLIMRPKPLLPVS